MPPGAFQKRAGEIELDTLLEVKNVTKHFPIEKGLFHSEGFTAAVQDVSFELKAGQITGLVGESGSGKSTLARMIQGLTPITKGEILAEGKDIRQLNRKERARFSQMVFQDPFASLNPKLSVGTMLEEAVRHNQEQSQEAGAVREAIDKLLKSVGLPNNILSDYPHQFSGGQRQRLGIARALALSPKLIIADEPVSALDLSIQSQILNLLLDLNETNGIAILLIAHDLSVVRKMADHVLVLKDGKIAEQGAAQKVLTKPEDPYTQKLLSSALTI